MPLFKKKKQQTAPKSPLPGFAPMSNPQQQHEAMIKQKAVQHHVIQDEPSGTWYTPKVEPKKPVKVNRRHAKNTHPPPKLVTQPKFIQQGEMSNFPPGTLSYFNESTQTIFDKRPTKGNIAKCDCPECSKYHAQMAEKKKK